MSLVALVGLMRLKQAWGKFDTLLIVLDVDERLMGAW